MPGSFVTEGGSTAGRQKDSADTAGCDGLSFSGLTCGFNRPGPGLYDSTERRTDLVELLSVLNSDDRAVRPFPVEKPGRRLDDGTHIEVAARPGAEMQDELDAGLGTCRSVVRGQLNAYSSSIFSSVVVAAASWTI